MPLLPAVYYRGAQAALIVFDICSKESFDAAKSWIKELQRRADPSIVMALVGNKSDLAFRRQVDPEEALGLAKELNMLYLETSAKNASNVQRLFVEVAKRVPRLQTGEGGRAGVNLAPAGGPVPAAGGAGGSGGCC